MPYHQSHHLFLTLIIILYSSSSSIWGQRITIMTSDHLMEEALTSKQKAAELFQAWMEKHKKEYSNTAEMLIRYENFKDSLKYVVERNSQRKAPTDHALGLTGLADMTHQEFLEKYNSRSMDGAPTTTKQLPETLTKTASCTAPASVNWTARGAVTPVKNQGHCGSCWAFSTTGALEGINQIVTGKLVSVSEQQLLNCVEGSSCTGGSKSKAFEWVIENNGIMSEEDYPYVAKEQACGNNAQDENVMTIDDYEQVGASDSALECAVVEQPISVSMNASSRDFQHYKGGIYNDSNCQGDHTTHAVLVVGYGSEGDTNYWIVKNSWGDSWGDLGYFYIIRDPTLPYGKCQINLYNYRPIKNRQEDYIGAKVDYDVELKEEL